MIIEIIKNWMVLFFRTKRINSFTNLVTGNILFPNKILQIKGNRLSGNIKCGEHISLYKTFINGKVTIGNHVAVNGPNTFLVGSGAEIKIGNFCSIARNVQIQTIYHNYNRPTSYSIMKSFFKENVKWSKKAGQSKINIKLLSYETKTKKIQCSL